MLALVWTLPAQKAFLPVGLFWAHGRAPRPADVFALIPEIAGAALKSGMLLQCSAQRWLRSGLAWGTVVPVMLSWLVIGAWLVAGAPFSHQMLRRLVVEPAMIYTAITSYDNYETVIKAAGVDQVELVAGGQRLTWGQGDAATVLKRVTEKLEHGVRHQRAQFIMAWTAECHMPYDYVEGQPAASLREQYEACHHSLARSVERFVDQLGRAGRLNDTLVVVLGDHGQIFPEEKAGEWGHGLQVYEPSLRIPVLLFIPGGEGGAHDSRLFQPVDISSTIIEYLGLSVPWNWVGRNMLEATDPGREFIVAFNLLMPLLQQD